jgi:hypothetical protein
MAIMNAHFFAQERKQTAAEMAPASRHTDDLRHVLTKVNDDAQSAQPIVIDGYSLELPDIVNAARSVALSPAPQLRG